jgi:Flp pilus assembly CpaE family ATPase
MDPALIESAIGRTPDHTVVSDGRLVVEANNQGVPFVLSAPAAPISGDLRRMALGLLPSPRPIGAPD